MKKVLAFFSYILLSISFSSAFAEEALQDVTGGNTIRGITVSGTVTWTAKMSLENWETRIQAEISGLTDPIGTDFYEWWLVRKSPFNMISTWKFISTEGQYMNFFSSPQDLSWYSYYVVTVEEDDEDTYPASEHLLEGKVIRVDTIEYVEPEELDEFAASTIELSEYQRQLIRKIELRLINVSLLQRESLLERVLEFQQRLPILKIEESKKIRYAEILEVLVYVLSK